jgi:LAS superfamily LD-carboxypeptidase LdcB
MNVALLLLQLYVHPAPTETLQYRYVEGCSHGTPIVLEVIHLGGSDGDGKPLVLEREAAEAFIQMRLDMAASGVDIRLNYAHRTMEQQISLFRKNRRLASPPGLSPHQEGRAIDVAGCTKRVGRKRFETKVCRWLRLHAHEYGFSRPMRNEPWHWEFRGRPDERVAGLSF